jgi:uncharacterized protein (DUF1501 family)
MNRRSFIRQSACAGVGYAGLFSALSTLRLFNASLCAQGAPGEDYRALVCLFLYGGNDGNNVLVPLDPADYAAYAASRGILALPQSALLPISNPAGDGRAYGMHPSLPRLRSIYQAGDLAFLANVGTLVAPITKAEYQSGGAAIPPYLFSHNDQQVQWQTSVPDSPRKVGWGGRLADLKQALNTGSQISMNISLAGTNFFQVGNEVFQYHVTPGGSVGLSQYGATWAPRPQQYQALRDILGHDRGQLFEQEYALVMNRAIANDTLLRSTLAGIPQYTEKFPAHAPDTSPTYLQSQLRMILRLIASRTGLNMKRQIFFCSLGGFDTHDDQLADHAELLTDIDHAVADFHQATVDLGVSDQVTLFTASDFNRTFNSNGKGSDHAWGSHQFAVGAGVVGGRIYGRMPVLVPGGPDDTGSRGAWIPSLAVDEYSATLAKWFGVTPGEMPAVLPNIGRFANPDIGFMQG